MNRNTPRAHGRDSNNPRRSSGAPTSHPGNAFMSKNTLVGKGFNTRAIYYAYDP